MFIYMSKKIAVPDGATLKALAWNKTHGYIAAAGVDGFLKVLKLESPDDTAENRIKGLSAPSNLDMNEQLDGHSTTVKIVIWNEIYRKLTSADSRGRIIVWVMYDGRWYEEMINYRPKTTVTSMQWSPEGERIAIAYDDGQVIVGSVDGQRVWGKSIGDSPVTHVNWSPEGDKLLLALNGTEVMVHDSNGDQLFKMRSIPPGQRIHSIVWYADEIHFLAASKRTLVITFVSGRALLLENESDPKPEMMETGLEEIKDVKFSPDGLYIAFAGNKGNNPKLPYWCELFNTAGAHLRSLKLPGPVESISWERLRLAISYKDCIYFANLRPDYLWGYCSESHTLVYAFQGDLGSPKIMFWNTKTGGRHLKTIESLNHLGTAGDHVVTCKSAVNSQLSLLNSIGAELDQITVPFFVKFLAVGKNFAIAASIDKVFVWRLKIAEKSSIGQYAAVAGQQTKMIDVDPEGNDEVTAICASQSHFIIARDSGKLLRYGLPSMELEQEFQFSGGTPLNVKLNSNSSKVSVIDHQALLYIVDLDARQDDGSKGEQTNFDRKECWNVMWASDDSSQLALNEKTKLTIFHDKKHEEPIVTSAFVSLMRDHEVECVLVDEIMRRPEDPRPTDIFVQESETLRNVRETIEKIGISKAKELVLKNSSPRLWRILGEAAMEKLELKTAEEAFIHCKDYLAIQVIKKLKNYSDDTLKSAEIAAFFGRHEDAENLYRSIDRLDLATEHQRLIGDEQKVLQILKTTHDSALSDDTQLRNSCKNIGIKSFYDKNWAVACKYLNDAGEFKKNIRAHYMAGDWQGIMRIERALFDGVEELIECGRLYRSLGLSEQAINAFIRAQRPDLACETAVELNDWEKAVKLAETHKLADVASLLEKKAASLLDAKLDCQASQLYSKAGNFLKAAQLLFKVAAKEGSLTNLQPVRVKKLYVLSALLVEQHHEKRKQQSGRTDTIGVLEGVLREEKEDIASVTMLDSAWRGAEAWHFYTLACKQLYSGNPDAAATTSICLAQYEDLIDPVKIYSLQATASAAARRFGLCSRAFSKLEAMPSLSEEEQHQYAQLAIKIFQKYRPEDTNPYDKMQKETKIPTCVMSGRPLTDCQFWMCSTCRHCAYENEIQKAEICPMCHSRTV